MPAWGTVAAAVVLVGALLSPTTSIAVGLGMITFAVSLGVILRAAVVLRDTKAADTERADKDPSATALRAAMLRQAEARLSGIASPTVLEGRHPRSHRVTQLLDHLFDYFIQDYVETWYDLLSKDDPEMAPRIKESFWGLTDALHARLEKVDWVTFLTRDVVMIITTHLHTLRQSNSSLENFPSHPALVSNEAEIRYLREMMDVVLHCVLPPEEAASVTYRSMLRELLTENLHRNINMTADYDYVNQCIAAQGEALSQRREQQQGKANMYASQKVILSVIEKSTNPEEIEDIRFKIISEMMQIKHLENLKRDATGAEERAALERLLEMDPKAAQLKSRNLSRYMHELRHVKRECERKLAQLGGPDYRRPMAEDINSSRLGLPSSSDGSDGRPDKSTPKRSLARLFGSLGGKIGNIGGTIKGTIKEVMVLEEDEDIERHTDSNLMTLPEIIGSIGIGYFMEYLRKLRAMKNIKFWISCNTMLKVAEASTDVPCGLVRNVFAVVTSRAEDKSQLHLKRETLDAMVQMVSRCCGHGCDDSNYCTKMVPRSELVCFVRAQREVYRYLYDNHYRKFVFSDEYSEYIRKCETANRRGLPREDPGPDGSYDPVLGPGVLGTWYYEAVGEERYDRGQRAAVDGEASFAEDDWCTDLSQWNIDVTSVEELQPFSGQSPSTAGAGGAATPSAAAGSASPGEGHFVVDLFVTVTVQGNGGDRKQWTTTRTEAEFSALHAELVPLSTSLSAKPPWNDSKSRWSLFPIVSSPKTSPAHIPAAGMLEAYLRNLLEDTVIKESEALFTFLKPVPRAELRARSRQSSRRGSASTSPHSSRKHSPITVEGAEAGLPGEAFDSAVDDDGRDSIAEPMYGLISEIFVLKGMFKWLRRQAIFFVKLTYGATINSYVEECIDWLSSEEQQVFYLEYFRDTMFPQEWSPPPPRNQEEKAETQEYAQEQLQAIMTDLVASIGLIGKANAVRGADGLFQALQSTHTNKHLLYCILEKFMEHLLPEITPRDVSLNLVVLNAIEYNQ